MINLIRFIILTSILLLFCSVSIVVACPNTIHEENVPIEIQNKTWNLVYFIDNNTLDSIEYPQGFEKIWVRFNADSVNVHGFCPTVGAPYDTYPNDSIHIEMIPIQESCNVPYYSPDWNHALADNLSKSFTYILKDGWLTIYTNGRYNLVFALPHIPTALMNKEWDIVYFIENSTSDTIRYFDDMENIRIHFTRDSVFVRGFCPVAGSGYELLDANAIHIDSISVPESCDVPYTAPPGWDHDLALDLPNAVHYKPINEWLKIQTTGKYSFLFTFSETTKAVTNRRWILDSFIEYSTADTIDYPDGEKNIEITIGIDSVFIHGVCSTVGTPYVRQNFDILSIEPVSIDKTCGSSMELLQWNDDLANSLSGFSMLEINGEHWLTISSGEYNLVFKSTEAVGIYSKVSCRSKVRLFQNNQNPFSEVTDIGYYLPETVSKAMICIYDMNGKQLKCYNINSNGNGFITIDGNELQAGMYMYTLIADGKVVDTKRMILTN
jgi:hypothetical protein